MRPNDVQVRRRFLGALAASVAGASWAQAWPSRPVHVIVPYPPGSAADTIPRNIGGQLQAALGVPLVIENRPGAAGAIGAEAAARAAPDGYTLLSHTSAITIQPHFTPGNFDPLRDLLPITQTIAGSYVLLVRPDFPAGDLRAFLAAVRQAPGRYSYGSYGAGSGPHLAMELLKSEAGLYVVHVPFRGAAPMMQELLAGRIEMAFDTTFAAIPHIRAGRLKPIAVGGRQRVDALPRTGRVADLYPGFDTDGWQGFFAPAATPRAIVDRASTEIAHALRAPDLAHSIAELGFRVVGSTPEQFAAVVQADYRKWGRVVRERRLKPD